MRSSVAPRIAFLSVCSFVWMLVTMVLELPATAAPLRVRGGSELDLLATQLPDGVKIRGEISDEMGASLGRVPLKVELLDSAKQPLRVEAAAACESSDPLGRIKNDATSYALTTDERGDFCLIVPGKHDGVTFRVTFAGTKLIEGVEATTSAVAEGEQRAQLSLKFEQPPATLDLDKDTHSVSVSVRIARADATRLLLDATKKQGLELVLEDERGTRLGVATTAGDGRARFDVSSDDLAAPGDGELKVSFAGDKELLAAKASVPVTRTATAEIRAPATIEGDPEGGLSVDVVVTTKRGEVDGGIVEALLGSDPVGTGKVEKGKAKLVLTFAGTAKARVPITLRYVAASPFIQAGETTKLTVVVVGPSPIRQIILAVVGVALAAWIVAKWRRAPKSEKRESVLPPPPSGRPEILVLDRPTGLKGWKGVVTDAHDGFPIENAVLRIVVPAFDGRGELARSETARDGTFSLDVPDVPRDARLIVEGSLHATYEQPLPAPSVLRVALLTRRRALLDRLVRWARARGVPFDSSKEPTPGHVRRVASRTGAEAVESWATYLEQAAFGGESVTREVEDDVMAREPKVMPEPRPAERGAAADAPPASPEA